MFVLQFRMTEFGTLEIVTEAEPKKKEEELTDAQTAVPQTTTGHPTNTAGKYLYRAHMII